MIIFLKDFIKINAKIVKSCLEYMSNKDELLTFTCLKYSKIHKEIDKYLIKLLANSYEFCDEDIKTVKEDCKRFDGTSLPNKESKFEGKV